MVGHYCILFFCMLNSNLNISVPLQKKLTNSHLSSTYAHGEKSTETSDLGSVFLGIKSSFIRLTRTFPIVFSNHFHCDCSDHLWSSGGPPSLMMNVKENSQSIDKAVSNWRPTRRIYLHGTFTLPGSCVPTSLKMLPNCGLHDKLLFQTHQDSY